MRGETLKNKIKFSSQISVMSLMTEVKIIV